MAIGGFVFLAVMMVVLIRGKTAPPVVFTILPLAAAGLMGFSVKEISEFVISGVNSMTDMAILFLFAISYFSLMTERGLFQPMIRWMERVAERGVTVLLLAVMVTTFIINIAGSGATTFLVVVPTFLPLCEKTGIRRQALLAAMGGAFGIMNLLPWAGPTMRAANVVGMPVNQLYLRLIPGLFCLAAVTVVTVLVVSRMERRHGAAVEERREKEAGGKKIREQKERNGFNLCLTVILMAFLFMDAAIPLYVVFMVGYGLALAVNFPDFKEQSRKIREYGEVAVGMVITLFSVGIFMGVMKGSGMVDAMAGAMIHVLPDGVTSHLHWYTGLVAVPLMIMLGTNIYYYVLLPIVAGVVVHYGITPEMTAVTFLLTAALGTPLSPSVPANYIGLEAADVSVGEHIRYSLGILWPASVAALVLCTAFGVIEF